MSGSVILRLPGMTPIPLTADLAPHLEAALREHRRRRTGARDLAQEVERFLRRHHAASVVEIARGIRARDHAVRTILCSDSRFSRVSPPAGRSIRVKAWTVSSDARDVVPASGTGSAESTGQR